MTHLPTPRDVFADYQKRFSDARSLIESDDPAKCKEGAYLMMEVAQVFAKIAYNALYTLEKQHMRSTK